MNLLTLSAGVMLLATFFACGSGRTQADYAAGRSTQVGQTPERAEEARTRPDGVRLVPPAEVARLVERGEAVILDVRGEVEFKLKRIKGAVSMPLGLIAARASELPKDKLLVAYCTCTAEQISARAVLELKKQGFENAAALTGGTDAWVKAGLPVEGEMVTPQPAEGQATAAADGGPGRQGGGRVAPPKGLKCGLDDLTLYDGEITAYERGPGSTFVRIKTNFDTTEEVTLKHPGADDASKLFLLNGEPFKPADWAKIEGERRTPRPGMRANVWVCIGDTAIQPVIDWRPDDTGAYPRSR